MHSSDDHERVYLNCNFHDRGSCALNPEGLVSLQEGLTMFYHADTLVDGFFFKLDSFIDIIALINVYILVCSFLPPVNWDTKISALRERKREREREREREQEREREHWRDYMYRGQGKIRLVTYVLISCTIKLKYLNI